MKKKKRKRVKRRLKVGRIIIALVVLGLIIFGGYKGVSYLLNNNHSTSNKEVKKKNTKEEEEKTYSLSLVMVGDNLIHDSIYKEANRNANGNGYDFTPMYTYLKERVKDFDLKYYNQETILGGDEIGLSSYPAFNSPYEVGDAMIDAGFNLVSLATNHTIDRGEKAVLNSYNYWKSKEDVLTAGSYSSFEERNKVDIREKNNITYTMLSYTYGTNGIPVPKGKEYLVNVWPTDIDGVNNPETDTKYQAYKETVKEDIERVRDKVDVLMVAMHWGVEYTHTPTEYQKDMAKFLADNGVDIVIGSHPHVVMPVTWIDDTLVIYSLGNMISAQETDLDYAKMVGLLTSVTINKTVKGDDTKIELTDLNNDLLYTSHPSWRNYKVIPFSNPDIKNYNSDYERLYNKYSEVIKRMDDSMPVMALSE